MIKVFIQYIYIRLCFYVCKFYKSQKPILNADTVKQIPIIITSFNQLKCLKELVEYLLENQHSNIVIIDNNSTYKPLLDYLDTLENKVTIHRLSKNYGHLVFWKRYNLFVKYAKGYYVVTDPDIVPMEACPTDFLLRFKNLLDKYNKYTKVGFGLTLEDIPVTNPNREKVINWEKRFWEKEVEDSVYVADLDTTFALYTPYYHRKNKNFKKALRTGYPYVARHGGWYIDLKNLSEEQKYYFKTANASSSWNIDENGNIINAEYVNKY